MQTGNRLPTRGHRGNLNGLNAARMSLEGYSVPFLARAHVQEDQTRNEGSVTSIEVHSSIQMAGSAALACIPKVRSVAYR